MAARSLLRAAALGTLATLGCSKLIGLGEFHPDVSGAGGAAGMSGAASGGNGMGGTSANPAGGAAGSGAAAGSGGTGSVPGNAGTGSSAGTGGTAATGGSAGSASGGAGGSDNQLVCSRVGSPAPVFTQFEVDRNEAQPIVISDPTEPEVHVATVLGTKVWKRSLVASGNSGSVMTWLAPGAVLVDGYVESRVLYLLGYLDAVLVEFTHDLVTNSKTGPTTLASPCGNKVQAARFIREGGTLHCTAQCENGDVFVDGNAGAVFNSSKELRAVGFAAGKHFVTLDDDGNGAFELRYAPTFAAQVLITAWEDRAGAGCILDRPASTSDSSSTSSTRPRRAAASSGVHSRPPRRQPRARPTRRPAFRHRTSFSTPLSAHPRTDDSPSGARTPWVTPSASRYLIKEAPRWPPTKPW